MDKFLSRWETLRPLSLISTADSQQNLAQFVRTHEKALANALQLRRQTPKNGQTAISGDASPVQLSSNQGSLSRTSPPSTIAAVLSLGTIHFTSQSVKAAKLSLTPHHLYYLLCKIEEIGVPVGPMNIRVENIHAEASPANYVSFLNQPQRSRGRSDRDSTHSVSSVRSAISSMSSLWTGFGIGASSSAGKTEKAKAQLLGDLKYLYSAFTKIPCLRLSPDHQARLIGGYEEFPFDTAVPLYAFKNVSVLEISDVDFRQFYGWDKLADQLRSLTVKRAHLNDPSDLLSSIVLDDMDRRRRRSSKAQSAPTPPWPPSPSMRFNDLARSSSSASSPVIEDKLSQSASPKTTLQFPNHDSPAPFQRPRTKSASPTRPSSYSRPDGPYRHMRTGTPKVKRSASGSSNSSTHSSGPIRSGSSSNLLIAFLPASKWSFLKHLSLADNALTSISASSLAPLWSTLHSLDLSSNLFNEVPDCLANMTALRALNLSNCMIESLHSLVRKPLPTITALNLRENRLTSIAGVERMLSLERLDLRDNTITDPTELARLTGTPDFREVWVLRNPFVKTHGNYRVTIFNLFRSTPGYTEDIIVDSTGPGYNERRQLRDRVIESERVPVKPKASDVDPIPPTKANSNTVQPILMEDKMIEAKLSQRIEPQTTQSEVSVGSARRKKGPRRRIVDLARDESPPVLHQMHLGMSPNSPEQTAILVGGNVSPKSRPSLLLPFHEYKNQTQSRISLSDSSQASGPESNISSRGKSLVNEIQSLNVNGEAYRSKVEALKEEVGSNWFSILGEQGWNKHRAADNHATPFAHHVVRPEGTPFPASSQGMVRGARALD